MVGRDWTTEAALAANRCTSGSEGSYDHWERIAPTNGVRFDQCSLALSSPLSSSSISRSETLVLLMSPL